MSLDSCIIFSKIVFSLYSVEYLVAIHFAFFAKLTALLKYGRIFAA